MFYAYVPFTEDQDFFDCDGICTQTTAQCKGKCNPFKPKKCGDECIAETNTMYTECEGKCIHGSELCKGECWNAKLNTSCGPKCIDVVASKLEYQCGEECVPTTLACNGTCSAHAPKLCGDGCIPASATCYVFDEKKNALIKNETTTESAGSESSTPTESIPK